VTGTLSQLGHALSAGLLLGLSYNPVAAVIGATLGAAVGAFNARRGSRIPWWLLVTAVVWLIGDGLGVLGQLGAVYRGTAPSFLGSGAPSWAGFVAVVAWGLVGWLVGYVLPAGIGVAVGKRVHFGTGWLAAAAVAFVLSLAFVVLTQAGTRFVAGAFGL
jgi:hypothetical protein